MIAKIYRPCALLFILMACVVWFSVPAHAQEEAALKKKIAEITRLKGEVRARTKMVWTDVEAAPYLLFSGDKVVTGRGRAEIVFNDGGILRLGLDSNVKISERKEEVGLIRKRIVTKRAIKVVLGRVYSDMKKAPDQEIAFKTPTMTAGIRGTVSEFDVDAEGETSFASDEPMDTTGVFTTIPAITEIDPTTLVGAREAARAEHPVQASAARATEQHKSAREAAGKAQAARSEQQEATRRAREDPTPENLRAAASATAAAAVVTAEAAEASAGANVTSAEETVTEAETMRDEPAAEAARATVEDARGMLATTTEMADNAERSAAAAEVAVTTQQATAHALTASTQASAAGTAATVTLAQANEANAEADADFEAAEEAHAAVAQGQRLVENATTLAATARETAAALPELTKDASVDAGLSTLQAAKNAADANVSAAVATTNQASAASIRDVEGAAAAGEAATAAAELATTATARVGEARGLVDAAEAAPTEAGARAAAKGAFAVSVGTGAMANAASSQAAVTVAVVAGDVEGEEAARAEVAAAVETATEAGKRVVLIVEASITAAEAETEEAAAEAAAPVADLTTEVEGYAAEAETAAETATETVKLAAEATGAIIEAPTVIEEAAVGEVVAEVIEVVEVPPEVVVEVPPEVVEEAEEAEAEAAAAEAAAVVAAEAAAAPIVISSDPVPQFTAIGERFTVEIKGDNFDPDATGRIISGDVEIVPGTTKVIDSTTIHVDVILGPTLVDGGEMQYEIVNPDGSAGGETVTIDPFPTVTDFTGAGGEVGVAQTVTITGTNFSSINNVAVNMGLGITATVTAATPTKLTVEFTVDPSALAVISLTEVDGLMISSRDLTVKNLDTENYVTVSNFIQLQTDVLEVHKRASVFR